MTSVPLYDDFSADYDRFVNWPARLAFELPFLRTLLAQYGVRRVLDAAAGTGQHALALAREGYTVTATDLSQGMVERARVNAAKAGVALRAEQLGFGELAQGLRETYDAVLCLGNSLPNLTSQAALDGALRDFAAVLKPGGVLVNQNRNFDRVLAEQQRFMPPETSQDGEQEWIFFRFYDFEGERLRFNVVRLNRRGTAPWHAQVGATELKPWRANELRQALERAGLRLLSAYGSYRGEPFDPAESGDLILVAQRPAL